MRRPDGKRITVSGVYRVIEPPHRIVFSWAWDDEHGKRGHETEITVTFTPASGGTRLVLLQKEFVTAESRAQHEAGWTSTLNCLEQALA